MFMKFEAAAMRSAIDKLKMVNHAPLRRTFKGSNKIAMMSSELQITPTASITMAVICGI